MGKGEMNTMIEVMKPGFYTTVQDLGRWGYQAWGVSVAGALDPFAHSIANLLVGNSEGGAGLEITLLGPTLKFHQETVFAITGAELSPRLNGEAISNWTSHSAPSGSTLSFTGVKSGARAYLAVSGGIDVAPVLGSRSTYILGRFGGLEGRALKSQDRLPLGLFRKEAKNLVGKFFPKNLRPPYKRNPLLRVVLGPFEDFFSEEGIRIFLSTEYAVTLQSDRMGYRLQGESIKRQKPQELISCGLANGTLQVPPNGQPIVLLADRQSVGGYPVIATVITADLPLIAQCAPGDKIRFSAVSLDEARDAYWKLWKGIKNFSSVVMNG